MNWYVQQTIVAIVLCISAHLFACLLVDGVGGWLKKEKKEKTTKIFFRYFRSL